MLSRQGRRALQGIAENIHLARTFIEGMDLQAFASDRRTLYAVVRCLEIISEASRRVDDETRERHPRLPWRQMADAGNVYRHAYENVSAQMVWRTVHERMGELLAVCEAELSLGPGNPEP